MEFPRALGSGVATAGLGLSPRPRNTCMPWVWPGKKKKLKWKNISELNPKHFIQSPIENLSLCPDDWMWLWNFHMKIRQGKVQGLTYKHIEKSFTDILKKKKWCASMEMKTIDTKKIKVPPKCLCVPKWAGPAKSPQHFILRKSF